MRVKIEKSSPVGNVTAPASKSMSHRLLICAGLSKGRSIINNISFSDDIKATLRCLEAAGCKVQIKGSSVIIDGINSFDSFKNQIFDCGESGSTLRFFIPICLLSGKRVTLKGSEKLLSRPLGVYKDICLKQGIEMNVSKGKITLDGALKADTFEVKGNISSQFISGLMFSLPLLDSDSIIKIIPPFESRPYVDMTAKALSDFGIQTEFTDENTVSVHGRQEYMPCEAAVEGDWSNAAFFYAFREGGADIDIDGIDENSFQGDRVCIDYFRKIKNGFCSLDLSDCPDLAPILFAFAAMHGGAKFTGTDRLRLKESDRIDCMKEELEKFGASVITGINEVTVEAKNFHKPCDIIYGHNDHRIVMSTAYLLSFTGGIIDGCEAVGKSFPDYFDVLKKTGVKIYYEA